MSTMKIINLQKLLNEALVGKKICVQPNLNPIYFGKVIDSVSPTSHDYGCVAGYMVKCGPSLYIQLYAEQELAVEE
jgi:hypothetical protein